MRVRCREPRVSSSWSRAGKRVAPPCACDLIAIGADVRSACSTRFQTRTPFALTTGSQFADGPEGPIPMGHRQLDGAAALYFAVRLRSPRALSNDTTAARAATPTHRGPA